MSISTLEEKRSAEGEDVPRAAAGGDGESLVADWLLLDFDVARLGEADQ
jgi:hypothetical protein